MKKNVYFLGLFFIIFSINKLNAQNITYEPNVKSEVHIQKDENGNIISYDSTYVETWSSDGSDIDIDEFMNSFGQDFANFGFDDPFFNSPNDLFNDTTSFNSNDFFAIPDIDEMQKQMIEQMQEIQKMFDNHTSTTPNNNQTQEEKNNIIDEGIKKNSVKI